MRLHIRTDQVKGMLGGASFETQIRIEVSPHEKQLIQQYKADKEVVFVRELTVFNKTLSLNVTVGDLINGRSFKSRNLYEHIEIESGIHEACKRLQVGIHAMSTIGKDMVYELDTLETV